MRKRKYHAVILSGGGADGAYQLGVGRALFNGKCPSTDEQPLDPDVFTGTSIGSFNAAFLVSQWQEYGAAAVGNLEKVWLERIAHIPGVPNGGFRIRFNPFDYLDPRIYHRQPLQPLFNFASDVGTLGKEATDRTYNLFSGKEPLLERLTDFFNLSSFVVVDPWEQTIRDAIDFRSIRTAEVALRIAATDWAFGKLREFKNRDMTDKLGPMAIRASSSVPGFYPPAQVGARTYVDGAVLMNTPLKPAIAALNDLESRRTEKAEEPDFILHVIYMNTKVERMPVEALQSTLQTLYRQQIISWASVVNQDILQADVFNDEVASFRDLELSKDATHGTRLKKFHQRASKYKLLTIHRYFPPDGLDGALGFLNVSLPRIKRLIEQGFCDAVDHDCQANECVLASDCIQPGQHTARAED